MSAKIDTRFRFGENWLGFLELVNEDSIQDAMGQLGNMLEVENLSGRRFLDVGSGSGLMSLAARRLGAKVYSFDYDEDSVQCTREMRRRYAPDDPMWTVGVGDVLDGDYLATLGMFDVVYAWGVLHHTGNMTMALENVARTVNVGGKLFIAIYNDLGGASKRWRFIKRLYVQLPNALKFLVLGPAFVGLWWKDMLVDTIRHGNPLFSWQRYSDPRGMSAWSNLVDWVGGYPYEYARPEGIFDLYRGLDFRLDRLITRNGIGCNEFVFTKTR